MAKTLLIGCGGTGIKALIGFNRQMAGDAVRRYRMWEDVSYLVIDTNRDDIESFKAEIAAGLESVNGRNIGPTYRTVHITRDSALLNDIVDKRIVRQTDEAVLSRLRRHWWFSPDGKPYAAYHRRDTGAGAGQCPPISYMFMWNDLPKIKLVIDSLLDEIIARNNENHNPLDDLRVYLIAGMSGGTGRGTWNLIAFKVRECILSRIPGARVDLPAIFLDSSCFLGLKPNAPTQKLCMRVNSLTGLSELSAWLAIRDQEGCYNYSLPALVPPDSGTMHSALFNKADVIHVHSATHDPYFQSPVRYAYLVFGDNGRQKLYVGRERNEYCNMVGVALYALIAHSHQFDGGFCNDFLKYCSFGAVSAEVETVKLRQFFNSKLRWVKIQELRSDVDADERDLYNAQLLKDFKLRQITEVNEQYLGTLSGEVSAGANIVELLMGKAQLAKGKLDPSNLRASLFKVQKYEEVKKVIAATLKRAKVTPETVTSMLEDLLNSWSGELEVQSEGGKASDSNEMSKEEKLLLANPLTRYLWQLVLKAYRFNGEPSVARAILCVNSLRASLVESLTNIGYREDGTFSEFDDGSQQLSTDCLAKSQNQWLVEDWHFLPDPYNETEQSDLTTSLIKVYDNIMYLTIREPLAALLKEARESLGRWHTMLKVIDDTLEAVADDYEAAANYGCTGSTTESAYTRLFVKTDMASIDASIPSGAETAKQIRRVFKPIMSRTDIEVLLKEKQLSHVGTANIEACIKNTLFKLLSKAQRKPTEDDVEVLKTELSGLFHTNVSVKTPSLDAKFTLEEVLRRNILHWNKLLDDAHNRGPDVERELQDRFRAYLGLRDESGDPGKYDYITAANGAPHMILEGEHGVEGTGPEGVKNRLPVSLMVNCIPWVLFDTENELLGVENLQQTILLPYRLSFAARDKIKAETWRSDMDATAVGVIDPSESGGRLNPTDRIVAFSSCFVPFKSGDSGLFDRIVSLQNDLKDPAVLQRVSEAESPDGLGYLGYFEPNPVHEKDPKEPRFKERSEGLGFVSPVFVEEPKLATRRWRPWKTAIDEAEAKDRQENFVYDVLAYAFTGSGLAEDSPAMSEISAEGWAFPLLARSSKAKTKKSGKFIFTRKALGIPDSEVCEWDANDVLPCTGIAQVVSWLLGKGVPDANGAVDERTTALGSAVFKRIVAEKRYFEEHVVKNFKPAFWADMVRQRRDWIAGEASTKATILDCDRDAWKKMLAAAGSSQAN